VLRDRAIAVDDFPQDFSVEQVTQPPAKTETLRKAA
jgi:ssDNA-specific exonuclease RecJ